MKYITMIEFVIYIWFFLLNMVMMILII